MASLEDTDKRISRQRGKKIKVGGKESTTQKNIYLKDGTKVFLNSRFGNPNNMMMNVTMPDGKRVTMNSSFEAKGTPGPSKIIEKDPSKTPKRESKFMKVFNVKADQIAKDTKDGKIKTLADLKNHPSYTSTTSGDIKNKLIGAFKKAGGDTSYKKVVKPEVKKKSAGSFAPEKLEKIKSGSFKGAGTSRGSDGVIQIQEPLLVDKKALDSLSDAEYFRRTGKSRFSRARGGIINAKLGAFIEVQNRFSDRMLPGKKRTTRIY